MKKILFILTISISVLACQPDDIPPIGDKTDYKPMLAGTWNLVKFEQTDVDAESKDFPEYATTKDLTNVFADHLYSDFSITFNSDGTFTSHQGASYMQMLSGGTWAFDDDDYPSAIVLTSGTSTQSVSLGTLADVITGGLKFKEERKQPDTGKVKIRYTYSLTKN